MLIPILPIYLTHIGYSTIAIGILEGIAECTAGISKAYFGNISDQAGRRSIFVQMGYSFSAVAKPLMALCTAPLCILSARTMDRFGKGIRTAARDALLSDEATPATKGTVFGFHRSMDTIGAILGPGIALLFLAWHPTQYKQLLLWTIIPGMIAVSLTLLLKERNANPPPIRWNQRFFAFRHYWFTSSVQYKQVVGGFLLFALFNSSDTFLLLKMKEHGISDTWIIGIYIFYNILYASFAFPLGKLGDRLGMKKIYLLGLAFFVTVYCGMAMAEHWIYFMLLFALYAIFSASTEGISKAWITQVVPPTQTATALGTYGALQSIGALIASSITGFVWAQFGSQIALLLVAVMGGVTFFYFWFFAPRFKELES